MGDNEEFSNEELEILGEEPSEEKDPETPSEEDGDKGEETPSGSKEKSEGTPASDKEPGTEHKDGEGDDKDPVPYDRFSKVYGQHKETERKLDLLKSDPEEYYRQYPDEKPKEELEDGGSKVPTFGEAGNLVVEGGEHDGLTLREVFEKDPFAAQDIYMQHKEGLLEQEREETRKIETLQAESNREIAGFAQKLASEMFSKADIKSLSESETKTIETEVNKILDWMDETGRGGGVIEDAYFLMNKDNIIQDAISKGATGLAKSLSASTAQSISSTKSESADGMDGYMNMTENELANVIDNMTEGEVIGFLKNAPKALKEKFPGAPWD